MRREPEQSGRRPSDSDRAHVLVSPGLPSTVCKAVNRVLSRQHVADARAQASKQNAGGAWACAPSSVDGVFERFRLRVEYTGGSPSVYTDWVGSSAMRDRGFRFRRAAAARTRGTDDVSGVSQTRCSMADCLQSVAIPTPQLTGTSLCASVRGPSADAPSHMHGKRAERLRSFIDSERVAPSVGTRPRTQTRSGPLTTLYAQSPCRDSQPRSVSTAQHEERPTGAFCDLRAVHSQRCNQSALGQYDGRPL